MARNRKRHTFKRVSFDDEIAYTIDACDRMLLILLKNPMQRNFLHDDLRWHARKIVRLVRKAAVKRRSADDEWRRRWVNQGEP